MHMASIEFDAKVFSMTAWYVCSVSSDFLTSLILQFFRLEIWNLVSSSTKSLLCKHHCTMNIVSSYLKVNLTFISYWSGVCKDRCT